jgi:hypothetical protein
MPFILLHQFIIRLIRRWKAQEEKRQEEASARRKEVRNQTYGCSDQDCRKALNSRSTSSICYAETQASRSRNATRGRGGDGASSHAICGFCGKHGHIESKSYSNPAVRKNRSRPRHQANHASVNPGRGGGGNNRGRPGGGRGLPMQCFKCGGSHSLKVCTKATPENLGPRKTAPASSNSSHTANQASTPNTDQANSAQTINVGRASPRGVHWAEANHVTVVKSDDSEDKLMPTQGPDWEEEVSDSESESSETSFSPYDDMMPNFMPPDDSSSAPNFDFEATIE